MINSTPGSVKAVVISNSYTPTDGLDITQLVTEVEIFTSMNVPFKSGTMVITDGVNALDNLRLVGGEVVRILLEVTSPVGEPNLIESDFIVDGVDSVSRTGNNNIYVLSLSSIYMYKNMTTRISEHFSGKTSDAIQDILIRSMVGLTANSEDIAKEKLSIEPSKDNFSFIVPNKRLSEALMWIAHKARSETLTPYYIFEFIDNSMAFASYGKLIKQSPIATYSKYDTKTSDPIKSYYEIKHLTINKTPNAYNNIVNGVYASKTFAYDLETKEVKIEEFNLYKYQKPSTLLNNTEITSGLVLDQKSPAEYSDASHNFVFSSSMNEPEEGTTDTSLEETDMHTDSEKYKPFLDSMRQQITQHQITCNVIGNVDLYPGAIVQINIPTTAAPRKGQNNLDKSLSGKYIVTNVRHIFSAVTYSTIFECSKDSWM